MADPQIELYYDAGAGAAWNSVQAREAAPVTMSRGQRDEGQAYPPGKAQATLDGIHNPKNPLDVLYGAAGRNTPMRVKVGTAVRSTVEVAGWVPVRDLSGKDALSTTDLDGAGILTRLGQGKTPLRSPAYRATVAGAPAAYWPLSDGSSATQFAAAVGSPLVSDGILPTPGAVSAPTISGAPGAYPQIVKDAAYVGAASGPIAGLNSTSLSIQLWVYVDPVDVSTDRFAAVVRAYPSAGTFTEYIIRLQWTASDVNIMLTLDSTSLFGVVTADGAMGTGWHHARFTAEQVGSDVEYNAYFDGVLTDTQTGTGVTLAPLQRVIVGALPDDTSKWVGLSPPTGLTTVSVGELVFSTDLTLDLYEAGTGWVGETAGRRFLRVCAEEGITASVVGDPDDTQPMGAQPTDTRVNVLAECARTDGGLMFEPADGIGLTMRTGRDLYNQASVLTVDYTAQQIAPTLAPALDNKGFSNDVTARRRGGGEYRAYIASGPLSIEDPPSGAGRTDTAVDVNTATDDVLISHANWWLHRGTLDVVRWPTVTVDLTASRQTAPFIAAVEAVDIGDRILLTGIPDDYSPDDAYLIVIGITESAGRPVRRVTFTCMPAVAFEVGIVGDGTTDLRGQAVDTDLSSLASAVTTTSATSLSVTSTGGVLWTTTAADWSTGSNGTSPSGAGLFIVINGEIMRVTNISGSSSPQTFTVVRHVNGVQRTHPAGSPVHVAYPARVGL